MKFKQFILSFYQSKGVYVLLSIVLTKLISFAITFLAIRMIAKDIFGDITYANSIIGFVVPFMGMGAFQGLLRYGTKFEHDNQKRTLFNYALKKGILFSLLLSFILYVTIPILTSNLPASSFYFKILVFQILGLTLFEFVKSYFRLIHKNHLYAIWDVIYYSLLLLAVVTSIYFYGENGYVWALVLTPFVVSVIVIVKYKLLDFGRTKLDSSIELRSFWKYGLVVSAGAVSSQFLYGIDIVMLGNIIKDSGDIAVYKASGLIPFSLRFIPAIFITTDYVKFAENENDRVYLSGYFTNYLKIFIPVSLLMILFFYFTGNLWSYFFGNGYERVGELIWIFSISIAAGFMLRIPIGNILTATKWAHYIAYITMGALLLNIILNYLFILKFGIFGAAWATAISMWAAGLVSLLVFKLYLNKISDV